MLRKDGIFFLNIDDSRSGGVPRVKRNGKENIGLSDFQTNGLSSESPCDVCVKIWNYRHIVGKDAGLVSESQPANVSSNLLNKQQEIAHSDTCHSFYPAEKISTDNSIPDSSLNTQDGVARGVRESTNPESFGQPLGACLPKGNASSSQDVINAVSHLIRECAHMKACPFLRQIAAAYVALNAELKHNNRGISWIADALGSHIKGTDGGVSDSYIYYTTPPHLKAKDLCLIPERLAIALQTDGWYVRSRIAWVKQSVMPESCKDRPTDAYETIWMLTKSPKYWYDAEAVRTKLAPSTIGRYQYDIGYHQKGKDGKDEMGKMFNFPKYRGHKTKHQGGEILQGDQYHGQDIQNNGSANLRNWWLINPQPSRLKHYAMFPEKLVERCIKASTPEVGCCPKCGKGWERVIDKKWQHQEQSEKEAEQDTPDNPMFRGGHHNDGLPYSGEAKTLGWKAGCKCGLPQSENVPSLVLDPFAGTGTTALVATKLGRRSVSYELSEDYCRIFIERNRQGALSEFIYDDALPPNP